jgi:transcriptional regulator of arginine metabolism
MFMRDSTTTNGDHGGSAARRDALRRIVRESVVGRQEDLVRLLRQAGHEVTQSSVSRDLRELGVAKRGDRYVLPEAAPPAIDDFAAVAGFVRSIRPAGATLTVIKTTAGAAQSVAIVLDRTGWPEVVGTISGDDTIFIATEDDAAQRRVMTRLRDNFRL